MSNISDGELGEAYGNRPKAAFLDFDGTLRKGNLSLDFIHYLTVVRTLPIIFKPLQVATMYSKKIYGGDLCMAWSIFWARMMSGKDVSEVSNHAVDAFDSLRHTIHSSSHDLVSMLKGEGYHPILVSAGAHEINSLAAEHLGIREQYSTRLGVEEGRYTGKIDTDLHTKAGKARLLEGLDHAFDLQRSVAFADRVSDMGMLSRVGTRIALNPSPELASIARREEWPVLKHGNVVEATSELLSSRSSRKIAQMH